MNRISRFHDEKNNSIGFKGLFDFPLALKEKIKQKLFNSSVLPIIPYPAIRIFQNYLNKEHIVYEYGSGRSTVFFACLSKHIYSVEFSKFWLNQTKIFLKRSEIKNFDLIYCDMNSEDYVNKPLLSFNKENSNIFIIDGHQRKNCAMKIIEICSENDIIYLDDSCKCSDITDETTIDINSPNNVRGAYIYLLYELSLKGFTAVSVRGFSPTHLFVKESTFFFSVKNKKMINTLKNLGIIY